MSNPYSAEAIRERATRHNRFAGTYCLTSLGLLALSGVLFKDGAPSNRIEMLAGAGAAIAGSLTGKKALDRATLAGAELGAEKGIELGSVVEQTRMHSPEYRQN